MGESQAHGSWRLGNGASLALDRARIMAILNITPDSFSDGGVNLTVSAAVQSARDVIAAGADMLDIGGESTRPGAASVSEAEQIHRVRPVIRAIRDAGIAAPISVDTTRAVVAEAALDAGAGAVNDISACEDDPEMFRLVAQRKCGVILMHRLRPASHDQYSHAYTEEPDYRPNGVVAAVRAYLFSRAEAAIQAGVSREHIVLDPGLGFGKSVGQNFALIRATEQFVELGFPVLGAASRKSFLGAVSGMKEPSQRGTVSVAASILQHGGGIRLFRVHDVLAHRQALSVADAAQTADI